MPSGGSAQSRQGGSWSDPTERAASAQGSKIVLCVTGGIAAYKAVEIVRTLVQLGAEVRVVMTRAATTFVGAQTFASVSGHPVVTKLFTDGPGVPHVDVARGADLAIVAPATANAMAKMARGVADDVVGSTWLMLRCPAIVAPAMHTEMWEHEATQENVRILAERGATIAGPASGALLSGDEGPGRLEDPQTIVRIALEALGRAQDLAGRKVVITAGGTQEPIDPVRYIGNRSSGLMGFEIAQAALERGAKAVLVAAPIGMAPPSGADVIQVRTAEEMRDAVLSVAGDADVIVMAAAVADFKPTDAAGTKLKKAEGPPEMTLVATTDILAELGRAAQVRKSGCILVGFAAETEPDPAKLAEVAEQKRRAKHADVIVANDVASPDSGFGVRTNRAVIAGPGGTVDAGLVTKRGLAQALLDEVVDLLKGRSNG